MENKGNFIGIIVNKKGVSLKLRLTPRYLCFLCVNESNINLII